MLKFQIYYNFWNILENSVFFENRENPLFMGLSKCLLLFKKILRIFKKFFEKARKNGSFPMKTAIFSSPKTSILFLNCERIRKVCVQFGIHNFLAFIQPEIAGHHKADGTNHGKNSNPLCPENFKR